MRTSDGTRADLAYADTLSMAADVLRGQVRDEYTAERVFWVPPEARWQTLQDNAKQPIVGKRIDEAMIAIERDNPRLKGILPKVFRLGRPALDKHRLGELIDVIGTIGLGDAEHCSKDILGRAYEYFLTQFASAEGKNGGQFYTPRCVGRVLVERFAPYKGAATQPAAARSACSRRAKSAAKSMAGGSATSRSTGRSPTRRRGGWR